MLIGVGILAGVLLLTFFVVFRKVDPAEVLNALKNVHPGWIITGICMMFLFSIGEALNLRRPLRMLGYKTTLWQAFVYAIVGFFFASITPSSTGGQPMQMYYMHQKGIKVSHSLFAVLVQLMGYESASVLLAILGYNIMHPLITETLGPGRYLLLVGIVVNLVFLAFIIIVLFSKRAVHGICGILIKIVDRFKGKRQQKITERIEKIILEYGDLSGYFKGNGIVVAKTFITSICQFLCMFLIPWLVYRGLGFSEYNPFQIILLQAVLFVAVGFIPIPGAAGVTESGFMLIYRLLYPASMMASAMLLTRTLNLYSIVLIYGIMLFIISPRFLRRNNNEVVSPQNDE